MNNIIKQIQILFDKELYSNVVKICDLALTAADQKPDSLTPLNKIQITNYYADSLYATEQYQHAEIYYRQCIQLRKHIIKNKNGKSADKCNDLPSEADLKYRIHLCLISLKKNSAALEVLQSISGKQKDAKINMALGNLLKESGMERMAAVAYKEVLEECPFALEAVESLLKLGMKGADVNSLTVEATNEVSWLKTWLKAQAQLYSRDFSNAIETYKQIDVQGILKDNVYLLVNMGYCYHYLCEDKKAIEILQRAHTLDSNMVVGLDLLSNLLADSEDENQSEYLESLVPKSDMHTWSSEHWVVFANYMYNCKNFEKAVYFAHQALLLGRKNNIEALLAKANSFFKLGKYQDAASACAEALHICSYRFDVHKCLVDCYLKMNRLREADTTALNACKQFNNSTHSLKLHARVMLKDPTRNSKNIKKVLEKAITQDKESSTNAVILLVIFLQQETQYETAKHLLQKQIENHPSSRLYQLLGDCFMSLSKDEDAFDSYNTALRLDPYNQRAVEGLNLIGPNPANSKRESYYTCVGDSSYPSQSTLASEHEIDAESDSDLWPNNSF
ncbi:hypothetical protein WA026_016076 [Henosepilachna vigintioctopunctata]|uniref:Anaphase-promoting complex subunit 7 n=1 Tax=Henosepilachna vigintioctopunctata TaxID=420089 RepID=A0AAW1TZR7_9CUCU